MIRNLWITGYRSYELGIFNEKDQKVKVLKTFLEKRITSYLDEGLEWIITGAQLGIEQYAIEAGNVIKKENHNLKNAIMLPFTNFSKNWNENNTQKFNALLDSVNYTNVVSNMDYSSPIQLKNWQQFMLNHTDGLLLIYDLEHEGKSKFDYLAAKKYADNNKYSIELVNFDDLEDFLRDIEEDD